MKNNEPQLQEIKKIYFELTIDNKWKLLLLAKAIKNLEDRPKTNHKTYIFN
ncbi:MAG: hypothetical protein VB082_09800 [Christensenella sp.]|nr:hypothetical protein [Christensenella sp.]